MAVDLNNLKSLRGVVGIIALIGAIAGAFLIKGKYEPAWLSACATLAALSLLSSIVTNQVTYVVVATGILISLAAFYVQMADSYNRSNYQNNLLIGYSLLASALGLGFVASANRLGWDIVKQVPKHVVAIIVFAINFTGCLVLWIQKDRSDWAKDIGITAFINGIIFLVGVTLTTSWSNIAVWINIFVASGYQYNWMASILGSYNAKWYKAGVAGVALIWIAQWLFVAYHLYKMNGANTTEFTGSIKPVLTSVRGGIMMICTIASIIGAFFYKDIGAAEQWTFANAILAIIFLLIASFNSGDRAHGWALAACGMSIYSLCYLIPVTNALAQQQYIPRNNETVCALEITCVFLAWLAYGLNKSSKATHSTALAGLRAFTFVFALIGLCCWWRFDDKFFAVTLAISIGSFFAFIFCFASLYLQSSYAIRSVAIFFVVQYAIYQLYLALGFIQTKSTLKDVQTGEAGMCICFISSMLLILAYLFEGADDGSLGETQYHQQTSYQIEGEGETA